MSKFKLIIISVIFCSCGQNDYKKEDYINPSPTKNAIFVNGMQIVTIQTYIIDNCEYVGSVNNTYGDFLTHKGNCKNHH